MTNIERQLTSVVDQELTRAISVSDLERLEDALGKCQSMVHKAILDRMPAEPDPEPPVEPARPEDVELQAAPPAARKATAKK